MKRENAKSSEEEIDIIDDLAGEKGDRYIGVVHIDGNNMGKKYRKKIIKETLQRNNDYRQAIKAIREFSILIRESYEKAYENMKKSF